MTFRYFVISGTDHERRHFMIDQFNKYGLNIDNVTWIDNFNNNDPIYTDSFIESIYDHNNTIELHKTNGNAKKCYEHYWHQLKLGQISCTYKHYLALTNFIQSSYD